MTKEEVISAQIVLAILRAYHATSIIRAIKLSKEPIHPLFIHIENTQYFTIINDISRLFDTKGGNLISLIDFYKNRIKDTEYNKLIDEINLLKEKHKELLEKIKLHRNKASSHTDLIWIHQVIHESTTNNIYIDLIETRNFLKSLIDLLQHASFIPEKEKSRLNERVGPKDAQDILGLKTNKLVVKEILKPFYND